VPVGDILELKASTSMEKEEEEEEEEESPSSLAGRMMVDRLVQEGEVERSLFGGDRREPRRVSCGADSIAWSTKENRA